MSVALSKEYRGKTTWPDKPMRWWHPFDIVAFQDLGPKDLYRPKPDIIDRGPMPSHSRTRELAFVLRWGMVPLGVQWALLTYYDMRILGISAHALQFLLYQVWFMIFALVSLRRLQRFTRQYGTLNEAHRGRDIVPDSHRTQLTLQLILFSFVRNAGVFLMGKDRALVPRLSLWAPVKGAMFIIVMDYFFYVYHRSTHEIDFLWKIHSKHHATKAPTASLSLWASELQDVIEWALIPFIGLQFVPLSFAELYLVSMLVLHVEAFGHSGIRAHFASPLPSFALELIGCEYIIEDHDIHHRYGRRGKNYGKQTRVWDVIFGTSAPREEQAQWEAKLH